MKTIVHSNNGIVSHLTFEPETEEEKKAAKAAEAEAKKAAAEAEKAAKG